MGETGRGCRCRFARHSQLADSRARCRVAESSEKRRRYTSLAAAKLMETGGSTRMLQFYSIGSQGRSES